MKKFEKLGAFYLGRTLDEPSAPFLYDSKDLTTHGLIVGMTGSGKTGLSVVLLEEAALDGVPSLVIDPKGDMGNLMLQFGGLSADEFRPWVDPAEATRKGMSVDELAEKTARTWTEGIRGSGQSKARIRALRAAAEVRIYTPGSSSGRPVALLRAFDAPPQAVRDDADALHERVGNAVSGLLGLVGLEADPVTSREHILLSNLLEHAWLAGENRDLESLVSEVQEPPFEKLGVLELESFFPKKERFALAMRLNNLLAAPAFSAWRQGEPLDIDRLLYSESGKPRVSILSIAHLSDEERMFFVTLFLNELTSWMRGQEGTGSLRAVVYMDEIYGYFPPVRTPPSKAPMLTLLKQARAYGLGVVLATQNPVDLDYKGLANIGTWFLGRLQTERDRERLLDGLTTSGGSGLDRGELQTLLSSLDKRVFLAHNVHEDGPALFHTRWALSYLRGPLTLEQLKELAGPADPVEPAATPRARPRAVASRPRGPDGIEECFLPAPVGASSTYEPCLWIEVELHFVRASYGVDHFETIARLVPLEETVEWTSAEPVPEVEPLEAPEDGVSFSSLPKPAGEARSYRKWQKAFLAHAYKEDPLTLYRSKRLKSYSRPLETQASFRARMVLALHERRDQAIEKLRGRYAPKLAKIQERIVDLERRLSREEDQYTAQRTQTVISLGETVLGALFGRKLASRTNVGRASRTARAASRASREREDLERAAGRIREQRAKLKDLESELTEKTGALRAELDASTLEIEEVPLRFRKSDTVVRRFALAWRPVPSTPQSPES